MLKFNYSAVVNVTSTEDDKVKVHRRGGRTIEEVPKVIRNFMALQNAGEAV
jgi:hypothetical protein